MKVLQINIFGNLSTGRIASDISKVLTSQGHDSVVAFARNSIREDVKHIRIGTQLDVLVHGVMARLTDRAGFFSSAATQKLVQQIEKYKPDIVHLHNLHGYYLNIEILFDYLKKKQIPIVWTLHDCWPYTGHCCYYSVANCAKWQSGCDNCPSKKSYPASLLMDQSRRNYADKKKIFSGANMVLVPVSYWLGDEVRKSFLKDYPIHVIQNGVDLNVFKPTANQIKEKYGIRNKLILAVSSSWHDPRKGLADLVKLSERIDRSYQLMIVGIEDKESKSLPSSIICLNRTDSVEELAQIYSAADVFVNASVEETFGLPTVEAMACGTPVIVYRATAIPEVVTDATGFVVEPHDIDGIVERLPLCEALDKNEIVQHAQQYSKECMMDEYLHVYKKQIEGSC